MKPPTFNNFPSLSSERLDFRPLRMTDRNEIYRLRSDEIILKYLNLPVAKNLKDAENFIEMVENGTAANKWITWGMCLKNSDTIIGTICLWNCDFETESAEVGYGLLPEFHQRGFMSETMKFTLDIGFNTFGFQEIDAITDCNNIGSRKLLEKFDFELDDKFESEETGSVRYFLVNRSNANTNVNGTRV